MGAERSLASCLGWPVHLCWVCFFSSFIILHDNLLVFVFVSVDGQVKLFDLRGADYAHKTWNMHPNGLSAFDVHPISAVFAG